MGNRDLAPTARLRWVYRDGRGDASDPESPVRSVPVLQQWWAEDLPGYMRDPTQGEWRDVPVGIEAP